MSLASIQSLFTPPSQYITGYGCPLVYAPDRLHIAEVGPCDPPKLVNSALWSYGEILYVIPLIQRACIWGYEWVDNPTYLRLVNEKLETPIIRTRDKQYLRQYVTLPEFEPDPEIIGTISVYPVGMTEFDHGNPPF